MRQGSRRAALALAALVAIVCVGVASAAGATVVRKNPVFGRVLPDPMILRTAHGYLAYGTQTDWEPRGHRLPILSSPDLVHWRYRGDVFRSPPRWASRDFWAPSILHRNHRWYLFYSAASRRTRRHCLAVATAHGPIGPFEHRRVVLCPRGRAGGYFDAAPLISLRGNPYLYFAADGRGGPTIDGIHLSRDLLHVGGRPRVLLRVSQPWEVGPRAHRTVEAPRVVRHGQIYDLLYSGNDYAGDYAMGYAVGTSPLGRFYKSPANPILRGNVGVYGPGGGSLVLGPDGRTWLAYHARAIDHPRDGRKVTEQRTLRVDPVAWHGWQLTVSGPTLAAGAVP